MNCDTARRAKLLIANTSKSALARGVDSPYLKFPISLNFGPASFFYLIPDLAYLYCGL